VSSNAITICVAPQRVSITVSVYFVIDSVRKLLDTPSYVHIVTGLTYCTHKCQSHVYLLIKFNQMIFTNFKREKLQKWRVAAIILNKHLVIVEKWCSSSLGGGRGDNF
jgi:hypothetical protein